MPSIKSYQINPLLFPFSVMCFCGFYNNTARTQSLQNLKDHVPPPAFDVPLALGEDIHWSYLLIIEDTNLNATSVSATVDGPEWVKIYEVKEWVVTDADLEKWTFTVIEHVNATSWEGAVSADLIPWDKTAGTYKGLLIQVFAKPPPGTIAGPYWWSLILDVGE